MAWLQRIITSSVPRIAAEKFHFNMSPFTFVWRWKSEMTDFKYLTAKSVGEKSNIGLIRLNDRRTMNTLSSALVAELNQVLRDFEKKESIACMILTGGERAFSVGADIREMNLLEFQDVFNSDFPSSLCEVSNCRKPIIAAVNGHAIGGGCELAMMCDIIYASENAVFAQPEISLATIPGAGGTQRLIRAVGKSKAMEMVLSGMKMSAKEACLAGLVSKVFPSDQVIDETIRFAEKVAAFSPMIVQMAKQAVNAAFETSLTSGLQYEKSMLSQVFAYKVARNG